jgi:phosphatidylglycerophosphate synthase
VPLPEDNRYEFTDASVVRPLLTRTWFEHLFPLLPRWLAANVITLISTGVLLAVLMGALLVDRLGPTLFALLQLVGIQLYVAGDHLDGMQAKATGTTSPLGDFLDHHCDYWAGCILLFAWCAMLDALDSPLLPTMTLLMAAGFLTTYAERATMRRLHFTSWGTLEAILICTVFYGSWAFPAARAWWSAPLWSGGWPRHSVISALGCAMAAGASLTIMRRMRGLPWEVALQLAALVAIAVRSQTTGVAPILGWFVTALCGAEMVARLMHAHTTCGARPAPTWLAVAGAAAIWITPVDWVSSALMLLGLGVTGVYAATLWRIIGSWRRHWVWINVRETAP